MSKEHTLAIMGLGVALPATVRKNDWWPEPVVAEWIEQAHVAQARRPPCPDDAPPDVRLLIEALEAEADDPFRGVIERRVAQPEELASDLEFVAAHAALRDAGVEPQQIGFVLGTSVVPDQLIVENLAVLHRRLGLRAHCLTLSVGSTCSGFLAQLGLARALLNGGGAEYGLVVQSSLMSRVLEWNAPHSPMFGDGATAVVVRRSPHGLGIVGESHFTDGENSDAVIATVRGKRWYEDGRVVWSPHDPVHVQRMMFTAPARARRGIAAALEDAALSADEIDLYAPHQGTGWVAAVTQKACGLQAARFTETYSHTGSLTVANIPYSLCQARERGQLGSGDTVVMFAGGAGETYSTVVMRWAA